MSFWKYVKKGAFTVARKSCFSKYFKNTDRDTSHSRDGSLSCDSNFERTVGIACESKPICEFIVTRIGTSIENWLRIASELNHVSRHYCMDSHRDSVGDATPPRLKVATDTATSTASRLQCRLPPQRTSFCIATTFVPSRLLFFCIASPFFWHRKYFFPSRLFYFSSRLLFFASRLLFFCIADYRFSIGTTFFHHGYLFCIVTTFFLHRD